MPGVGGGERRRERERERTQVGAVRAVRGNRKEKRNPEDSADE